MLLSLFLSLSSAAQHTPTQHPIIPKPAYAQFSQKKLQISSVKIAENALYKPEMAFWMNQVSFSGTVNVPQNQKQPIYETREIRIDSNTQHASKNPSYYELKVDSVITIHCKGKLGAFYAGNTLYQLLEMQSNADKNVPKTIFVGNIVDSAVLNYRGMHLDVSRHFFDVAFIKQYLDVLALYKFNTFHWHLTDDQGWRIEIKRFPKLHAIGSFRKETMTAKNFQPYVGDQTPHAGYYTQEEVKEIVRYAAERNIEVIPEIEMPGHCRAALAAYPQFSCNKVSLEPLTMWGVSEDVFCVNDSTFQFIYGILDEVLDLFPGKTIHIGGDEVPKTRWKSCATCQQTKRANALASEEELQSYFIRKIDAYLTSKNRNIIGWDEILEGGLSPNAQVMSWRGTEGGLLAARQKHSVVMTPGSHCYFDHYQGERDAEPLAIGGFTPVEKVYSFEPIPQELEPQYQSYILGAQANVWTEYIATPEHVLYMILPRLGALSEVLWNTAKVPIASRNFSDFRGRLLPHFNYYDKKQLNYSRSIYQLKSELSVNQNQQLQLSLSCNFPEKNILYSMKSLSKTTNSIDFQIYTQPIIITKACQIQAYTESEKSGKKWNKTFHVNKATAKPIFLRKNPSARYNIGGPLTLNDGIVGNNPWISKEWLGWLGDTMDATLTLDAKTSKKDSVFVYFLNAPESWIHLPQSLVVFGSKDGKNFKMLNEISGESLNLSASGIVSCKLKKGFKYIRIVAVGPNKIPANNPGAGESPWLFCSEIQVK